MFAKTVNILAMQISIRKSTATDAPELYEVWRTAVDATHNFLSDTDRSAIATLVRDEYLPVANLDLAVDENDKPLAFMGMTDHEIDSLFVHVEARGTGLGRLLVELAFKRGPVILTEVNEQNHQGVGFWKHVGFQHTGRLATDRQGRCYPLLQMQWRNN